MRHCLALALLVIFALLSVNNLATEATHISNTPSPEKIPTITEITIHTHPIFDESNPKENNFIFRLINKLHIDTKKSVIEKDLTFKQGDPLDKHLLDESERRLRGKHYFSEATINVNDKEKTADENNEVTHQTVKVDVHEVWTLVPKLSFTSAGGNTNYGYGLHDSNFLGLGKTLKIEHSVNVERTSDIIQYRDLNFGNKNVLIVSYADNSDGKYKDFRFNKPFSSIRTPWSSGVAYQDFLQEDTLYNAGEEVERFGHLNNYYSIFYGIKLSDSTDEKTSRFLLGLENSSDEFLPIPTADINNPFTLPFDRNYQTLWLEYAHINNNYFKTTNIQHINRTEDINLGSEWHVRIGRVTSDNPQLDQSTKVEVEYAKAFTLSTSQLILSQISSTGFYTAKQSTQAITQAQLSYHWQNFQRAQFYISANQRYGENLFVDTPLELGGDTGLRGYPARFQAGNKLNLLTVEQRYFGQKEWFSLFHVGAAIFYDQGHAWGDSAVPQTYQQTLRDVGIGLRISGTRTGGQDQGIHNIAHIDLSYPLDGGNELDKYQWSVRIKSSF